MFRGEFSSNSILVVGGGISGIQAALDLADQGYVVYLVERSPSIGGHMAQLDKTFPTNDCSMCILAPKMVDCGRHSNIKLMTYSEIVGLEGSPGNFTVKVLRKPRYVDESKCTGCGLCALSCPIEVPNEFDLGLSLRHAIYLPFAQAYPNVYTIDYDNCINCETCKKRCPAEAINLHQKPIIEEVKVGSIILALGYKLWNPKPLREYGFGVLHNVITSLQFERILSSSGPTGGEILRPSDGTRPQRIAFIQCVGSRSERICLPYCSSVCCMYATKEAVIAKEHDPNIQPYIFYIDTRAAGKGFQEYLNRARDEIGIIYIKALPAEIRENDSSSNLVLWYEDTLERKVKSLEVDLVILCPAIVPNLDSKLQQILRIDLDKYGFIKAQSPSQPIKTTREGIFVCGMIEGPKDIPDSVIQASGAASLASMYASPVGLPMKEGLGRLREGEVRIGVFICSCGINIGSVVNVPDVVGYAKSLPGVVYAEGLTYSCSTDGLQRIKDAVEKYDLNRVVVASCTPRTHEPLFQSACVEVGLNPYLFVMANIREQCSWVHQREPDLATQKAKDLVRMAVSKAKLVKPLKKGKLKVRKSSLVIGGGISGLTSAITLAEQGFEVHLVERETKLGGLLNEHYGIFPNFESPENLLNSLISAVRRYPNIHVYTSSEVDDLKGFIGDFRACIRKGPFKKEVNVGTIIVATGAQPLRPVGLYGYGKLENVITQSELEQRLKAKKINPRKVVMIQCVGAREKGSREYCSRICCSVAVGNSIVLKREFPKCEITILYRDVRTLGKLENLYNKAREMGVKFINFIQDMPPEVRRNKDGLEVNLYEATVGKNVKIDCDFVVLSTPLIPTLGVRELSSMLKVPIDVNGFFLEKHVKLDPVSFATRGIYLCGTAHSPRSIADSITQAFAVASKAAIPMKRGVIETEAVSSYVDEDLCVGCGTCVLTCEYDAPSLIEKSDGTKVSRINEALCVGCGACVAACPTGAIEQNHFTTKQIFEQIKEAVSGPSTGLPKIVTFLCNWCGYAGADLAGVSRFQYPPSIRVIRLMCAGRFDIAFALSAFLLGADGVLVCGCHPKDCHYISGNLKAERRVELAKKFLEKVGIDPKRLRIEWVSAAEGKKFSNIVEVFTKRISELNLFPKTTIKVDIVSKT